jgi:hypothetical protein
VITGSAIRDYRESTSQPKPNAQWNHEFCRSRYLDIEKLIRQSRRCGFQPHGLHVPLIFLEDRAVGNRTYDYRNILSIINQRDISGKQDRPEIGLTYKNHDFVANSRM